MAPPVERNTEINLLSNTFVMADLCLGGPVPETGYHHRPYGPWEDYGSTITLTGRLVPLGFPSPFVPFDFHPSNSVKALETQSTDPDQRPGFIL